MSNFDYLRKTPEFKIFADAAVEAESVYYSAINLCAVGCRKALELGVKWVYSADNTMRMPYRDNLQSLIHEPTFKLSVDPSTWSKLPYIIKVGNLKAHTGSKASNTEVMRSMRFLFEFTKWIDYCYGSNYEEREFDENAIPKEKVNIDNTKIEEQKQLINKQNAEIEKMKKQLEAMSAQLTANKAENTKARNFEPEDISEFETRKAYIDIDLKMMGWHFDGINQNVSVEYKLENMADSGKDGFADYVIWGKDGLPLAVIEAKRTSKDPNHGRQQALLYADCLEKKFGQRPMMFTANGFETFFWDDKSGPQRQVSGIFSRDDLQKLMNRRTERKNLLEIPIKDKITDRYYQKAAIRAVCEAIQQGTRKNLFVMATGTGKTRTASSTVDVLSLGGYVSNVLFLADQTNLVRQAHIDFNKYITDTTTCNLCEDKEGKDARIIFSTYPTILNAIDTARNKNGTRLYTPAHFDLIIVDESHRSIFKKYKAIFQYFDSLLLGLTATPKDEVARNTYDFFELETGVPTYAYLYETAVNVDHVLVPYYNYEVKSKFIEEGITYDDLSDEDKERYEEDFCDEDGNIPEYIPSQALNKFIFNQDTVDEVIQDLMTRGIKTKGGELIGKTIIFAQGKQHAEFILQRINKLYPEYKGKLAKRVIHEDSYAQSIIDEFRFTQNIRIIVSVDMMDTGVDVPDCVNLVFFKKVRSRTKFWQMIGRGTRLCPEQFFIDSIEGEEYQGKKRFFIFDYCGNFEFFRQNKKNIDGQLPKTLSEEIFCKQINLIYALQDVNFVADDYQKFRKNLVTDCNLRINFLDTEKIQVRLHLRYVEKYKKLEAFTALTKDDKTDLFEEIAPLITNSENDDAAKRFDNFMYGLMLSSIEQRERPIAKARKSITDTANMLMKKITIPQVKEKLPVLKKIISDEFWENINILAVEQARQDLRGLIKYLIEGSKTKIIYTMLKDDVQTVAEGNVIYQDNLENYEAKVNRYINENMNTLVIHKITHNIPITAKEYEELERIFMHELGSKVDYEKKYHDKPLGLMIRSIAKLDHETAMQVFSEFINDASLNSKQIAFVNKVITYIENNGYVDDLLKPPFDKPANIIHIFKDKNQLTRFINAVKSIKDNAVNVI